jgi:hypothetical protein
MRSTIFDNSENEKMAAAVMLTKPAMVVARRMESSVELILSLDDVATKLQIKAQMAHFGKPAAAGQPLVDPRRVLRAVTRRRET